MNISRAYLKAVQVDTQLKPLKELAKSISCKPCYISLLHLYILKKQSLKRVIAMYTLSYK